MKPLIVCLFVLISFGAIAQDGNAMISACMMGDLAAVKDHVEKGGDVNFKNATGQTPLASSFFWADIATYLLSKGADVNGGEYPALVNACNFYSEDVIDVLLKAGADPNKVGVVKVDIAAGMRQTLADEKAKGKKANKYLIKAYEDQIEKMPSSALTFSPLQNAVRTNCGPCIDKLLQAGAKTAFKNEITGGNLIHELATNFASPQTRIDGVKTALPYFEKAGMKSPEWYANLDPGVFGVLDDNIKLLMKNGVDLEGEDNNKQTPLKAAVASIPIKEEVVLALINNGASLKNAGVTNTVTAFAEETDNIDKIKVKFDFPHEGRNSQGSGYSANMDILDPKPKRVALISYYLYDAGKGKSNITGTAAWRTSDFVGQEQVNGFYNKSIDKLKDTFKQNGISLLTPDEFLDTEEKANAYYGFVQETAKKEKTTLTRSKTRSSSNTVAGWTTTTYTTTTATVGSLKVAPYGFGYRTFFVANEAEDESMIENFQGGIFTANRKLTSNLGYELANELGVDAVLVVYIATRKPKQLQDDYGVNAVVMIMLGPNPGKAADTDPEAKNLGQFYCGTRTYYSNPLIFKEQKGIFSQYDGMGNVLTAHATKMCNYVLGKEKD
jgi:ankyrin repeat protein